MKSLGPEKRQALREWRRGASDLPRRPDKTVGVVLEKLLPKLGLDQQVKQSQLVADWPQVVGDAVARHAKPVALRDGVLTLAVDHPVWLSELSRYQKPLLLRKVRAHLGAKAVRDIMFRVEG
jgi:predicted nucleic acid-binding Zn ribbon protein